MAILNEQSPLALYYQLKQIFIKKIRDNHWTVGTQLPGEMQLSNQYQVSRATVRQALKELELEGYVTRRQGKGTFVAMPKLEQRLASFYSFSDEIRSMGFTATTSILEFNQIRTDTAISARLQLPLGAVVYRIKRLRFANGEPFAVETSYVPYNLYPELTRKAVDQNGLYATMSQTRSLTPSSAQESFEAILISPKEAEYLDIANPAPGLYLERTTYSDEAVVEYCETIIRGDRYKYHAILQ